MPDYTPPRAPRKRSRPNVNVFTFIDRSRSGDIVDRSHAHSTTIANEPAVEIPLAADVMPAMVATAPVLGIVLLLAVSDQELLLRTLLYEGNPVALAASMLPLFTPTLAALAIYLAAARGWVRRSPQQVALIAAALAGTLALFVPLNYFFAQLSATAAIVAYLRSRRMSRGRRVATVTVAVIAALSATCAISGWEWRDADHLPRTAVGRVLTGITQMNVGQGEKRHSVMVISVNDAYAIVASRGYPARVTTIALDELTVGELCVLPRDWDQRSIVDHLGAALPGDTARPPACLEH